MHQQPQRTKVAHESYPQNSFPQTPTLNQINSSTFHNLNYCDANCLTPLTQGSDRIFSHPHHTNNSGFYQSDISQFTEFSIHNNGCNFPSTDQDSFFMRHSSTANNFETGGQEYQSVLPSVNNLLHNTLITNEDDDELPPTIDISRIRSNNSSYQPVNQNKVLNECLRNNQSNFSNYPKSLSVPTPPSASYHGTNSYQLSPSYVSNNQILNMQYDTKKTPSPSNNATFDSNQLPPIHNLTNDMMDTTSNNSSSFIHKRGHSDPNFSKAVPYNFSQRGCLTQRNSSPSSPSVQIFCNSPGLMSTTTPISTPSSYVSTARSVISPNTPTTMGNDSTSSPSSSHPPTIQIGCQKSKAKSASVKSPGYDQLWFNTKYRFMGRNKYTEFKSVQDVQTDSKITKSSKMKKNLNVNSPMQ